MPRAFGVGTIKKAQFRTGTWDGDRLAGIEGIPGKLHVSTRFSVKARLVMRTAFL